MFGRLSRRLSLLYNASGQVHISCRCEGNLITFQSLIVSMGNDAVVRLFLFVFFLLQIHGLCTRTAQIVIVCMVPPQNYGIIS